LTPWSNKSVHTGARLFPAHTYGARVGNYLLDLHRHFLFEQLSSSLAQLLRREVNACRRWRHSDPGNHPLQ
jgi:hypothetical protein